ncbi:major facilitator superfamily transporter multidrug resistance [Grosmannia clavigera kw1407]|uniref:Major facilitator superfamily transporter multidrug resistance n=1 Tax=Grosmannia clavigera (strain kw1407 / UAMH 11150) TaxID=655863 RepID=F0XN45_GROCL|nr:major facilitator superfamily transporter multidrug resistance [Grosmannia clavigera kw1407]EFX00832.1 major facilitator superfamily transporter multidrug resistance [Grosmannia clavigera kw1407]
MATGRYKLDPLADSDTGTSMQEELRPEGVPMESGLGHTAATSSSDGTVLESDMAGGKIERVDNKAVFRPTRSFFLAFSALMVVTIAIALDATSMSVSLSSISAALGGSALEAFWSGTSFLLASTVLQPTAASLSNIFGRKYLIYVNGIFFFVGSLVAALANNFTVLIVGRTIQGIGGGSLIALTEVVVTDLVSLAFRPTWFSVLSAMWSLGTVSGPLVGAAFTQNVSWRWIFYINLPMIGVGMAFIVLFLHQAKIPGGIIAKTLRFDWVGSVLFTASSTSFLYGLSTGGVSNPWSSYRVLLPLILGFLGTVAFGFYEFRVAREPIINRRIFSNLDIILTYIMTVLHGAILWSVLYFLPLYYEAVKGYSTVITGVAVLPITLTVAPAASAVGVITGITGRYRWSIWIGWALTTMGSGLLLLLKPDTSVAAWIWLNVPLGVGTGMLFPAMGLSIQAACEPVLNGQASAFFSFLRTFGQSIGVAVSGVIFQNSFKRKLAALPAFASLANQYSHDATSVVAIIRHMPASVEKTQLVKAYNEGLHVIYVSMIAFSAFCLILSVFLRGYSLNQEHVTSQALINNGEEVKTEKE